MTARSVIATEGHAAVWAVREGKGVRVQLFPTWAEALEATGLREQRADSLDRGKAASSSTSSVAVGSARWPDSFLGGDARIVERVRFVPQCPCESRDVAVALMSLLDRGCLGRVLADLERGAASAGGDDIGVVHLEAGALQAVDVVDFGAEHELHAGRIDDYGDLAVLEDVIILLAGIERQRVLKARAAAAADGNAQRLADVLLRGKKLLDLLRRLVGEIDCRGCLGHRLPIVKAQRAGPCGLPQAISSRISGR